MATCSILEPLVLNEEQYEAFERIMNKPSTYSFTPPKQASDKELNVFLKKHSDRLRAERK